MRSAPARRRGPAPILIIAAVIAVLILCWVFGRGCGGSREARENDRLNSYTVEANKPIKKSADTATKFNSIANGVKNMAKADVDSQLGKLVDECKSISEASAKVKVPSKALDLQPLAQLALNLRTQGVEGYRKGIMGVLNNTGGNASAGELSKAFQNLATSDQVFQSYRGSLDARLKAAKERARSADPGQYVASIDSASTAAVNAYIASIGGTTSNAPAATTPAQAMQNYLKSKGIDTSAMSFSVVSESASDPSWKIDVANEQGGEPLYFLLRGSNGSWAVVDSGTSLTAAKLKADGAPADLKAP
jgi:hypothetical protein